MKSNLSSSQKLFKLTVLWADFSDVVKIKMTVSEYNSFIRQKTNDKTN